MLYKTATIEFRTRWIKYIYDLQERICTALSEEDGKEKFAKDEWQRAEGKGGGGITRTIANGNVIEKGGVNTSAVYGKVTDKMRTDLRIEGSKWFAALF
jgi:coproporphyrinogen III oxidase